MRTRFKIHTGISISLVIILIYSCQKDFIVKDISKSTMQVNAPANNTISTLNQITFWWEPLDGAESYNLQVVSPDFAKIAQVVADTNISGTKFVLSLNPGKYQWRIKASNAGHSTVFQVFNLQIDSTTDLSGLLVSLISPTNGAVTGHKPQTFMWSKLFAAGKYNVQINAGTVLDTVVTANSLTYILPASSGAVTTYSWNVRAENGNSQSKFNSSPFTISVDRKPPTAPSLNSPLNGALVTSSVSLTWTRNNATDVVIDSVYVATDSLFTNVISQTESEGTNIKIQDLPNPPVSPNTPYWWRVRSFDAVGNRSVPSALFKFTLVP